MTNRWGHSPQVCRDKRLEARTDSAPATPDMVRCTHNYTLTQTERKNRERKMRRDQQGQRSAGVLKNRTERVKVAPTSPWPSASAPWCEPGGHVSGFTSRRTRPWVWTQQSWHRRFSRDFISWESSVKITSLKGCWCPSIDVLSRAFYATVSVCGFPAGQQHRRNHFRGL